MTLMRVEDEDEDGEDVDEDEGEDDEGDEVVVNKMKENQSKVRKEQKGNDDVYRVSVSVRTSDVMLTA